MDVKINYKKFGTDLKKINQSIAKKQEKATIQALNRTATDSKKMLAELTYDETGIGKATAKRRMKVIKATKDKLNAQLDVSNKRIAYSNTRQLRSQAVKYKRTGISFTGTGRQRKKIKTEVKTQNGLGTIPFVIRGKNSGKKLAVYVLPEFRKAKTATGRKVRALYYSSLAHVGREKWQGIVNKYSITRFKHFYQEAWDRINSKPKTKY